MLLLKRTLLKRHTLVLQVVPRVVEALDPRHRHLLGIVSLLYLFLAKVRGEFGLTLQSFFLLRLLINSCFFVFFF